jgi:hypothetical protein
MYRRSKSARLLGEQEAWEVERKKKEFDEEFYRSGRRRRQKVRENARWASGDERGLFERAEGRGERCCMQRVTWMMRKLPLAVFTHYSTDSRMGDLSSYIGAAWRVKPKLFSHV